MHVLYCHAINRPLESFVYHLEHTQFLLFSNTHSPPPPKILRTGHSVHCYRNVHETQWTPQQGKSLSLVTNLQINLHICQRTFKFLPDTVSDKNSWDTQTKRCFFPSCTPLFSLKVVYRSSVTKPCTPTLREQGDTKVS